MCNLKKVFDIDLTEKSIVIDNSLAALLERINNAYESYKNYRLTDDEFNTLIEGAKRIYNEESNYNNVEPENKTKYYFQTFEEQLMEILSPKIK